MKRSGAQIKADALTAQHPRWTNAGSRFAEFSDAALVSARAAVKRVGVEVDASAITDGGCAIGALGQTVAMRAQDLVATDALALPTVIGVVVGVDASAITIKLSSRTNAVASITKLIDTTGLVATLRRDGRFGDLFGGELCGRFVGGAIIDAGFSTVAARRRRWLRWTTRHEPKHTQPNNPSKTMHAYSPLFSLALLFVECVSSCDAFFGCCVVFVRSTAAGVYRLCASFFSYHKKGFRLEKSLGSA